MNVPQLRAARALVGWSQDQLAKQSGVSKPTIARLELGSGELGGYDTTREKLVAALEAAGVIFVDDNGDGPGVRLRKALAGDVPRPTGPTTDAVEPMDAAIKGDRRKRER